MAQFEVQSATYNLDILDVQVFNDKIKIFKIQTLFKGTISYEKLTYYT